MSLPRWISARAEGKRKHTFYSHHLIRDPAKYGKLRSSVQKRNICSVTGWQLLGPVSRTQQRCWRVKIHLGGSVESWQLPENGTCGTVDGILQLPSAQLLSLSCSLSVSSQSLGSFRKTPSWAPDPGGLVQLGPVSFCWSEQPSWTEGRGDGLVGIWCLWLVALEC